MPVRAPPVRDDPVRQDDDIPCLLFAVDDDVAEAVSLDPRQSITSDRAALTILLADTAVKPLCQAPRPFADTGDGRVRGSGAGHNRRVRLVPWIPPLFRDRAAAGRALSEALSAFELDEPVVVIGVARGGVAVAVEVARVWLR